MTPCPKCGTMNPAGNDFCESCAGRLAEGVPAIDRYELEGVLGRGASSVVYRAKDRRTGRPVAVKALNPELLARPGLRERLREEARALQQLSQENVVGVVDYVETDDAVWLVTEAVEGASLRTVLMHAHQLEPEQALAIFTGMLAGLAHAHGRGIVHGDLKPENVLVEASGTAKLVDFGQAVRAGQATTGGTAAYMSPEAVRGEPIGPASDLYSVGAVLYEALTGRPPFLGANEEALMRQQLEEPTPPIVGLPPAIGTLVEGLLAKDPAHRPASAEQALAAFEAAVREAYGTEWRRRAGVANLVETSATRFPTLTTTAVPPDAVATAAGVPAYAAQVSGGPTPDEQDLLARGVRFARLVVAAELVWVLTFLGGGLLMVESVWANGNHSFSCVEAGLTNCPGDHGLLLPFLLILAGFLGFWLTGALSSLWAVKRYGAGVLAFSRRRRRTSPRLQQDLVMGSPMRHVDPFAGNPTAPGGPAWPGPGVTGPPSL